MKPLARHLHFVRKEKSGDDSVGIILVGTINIRPSGILPVCGLTGCKSCGAHRWSRSVDRRALSLRHRSAAQGFSVRKESGPSLDSTVLHTFSGNHASETRARFKRTYSTGAPARRCSSRVKAAVRPEMPPPMMAIRFMFIQDGAGGTPALRLSANQRLTTGRGATFRSPGLRHSASAAASKGESFSDSARQRRICSVSANCLKPMSMSYSTSTWSEKSDRWSEYAAMAFLFQADDRSFYRGP